MSISPPKSSGSLRARLLGVAAALAVSGVSLYAAARFQREPPPPDTPARGMTVDKDGVRLEHDAPQWKVLRMERAEPAVAHLADPLPARIQMDESRLSRVGTPLAGRVTRVFVERGGKVVAGAPLFAVSSPALADLKAERDKAAVEVERARADAERLRAVVEAHAAAPKDLLAAEKELEAAQVGLRAAQEKLRALRVENGELTVPAPRDGTIVERNVSVGQSVSPDATEPAVVLADLSTVWVVADLFEAEALDIREGSPAFVQSPALPVPVMGTVAMVSSVVDPVKHTIPIRVRLPNPGQVLRPNLWAQVRFTTPAAAGAVEVPASAVLTDGVQSYVYLAETPAHFVKRPVTVGAVSGRRVAVHAGLKAGDTVVTEGGVLLDNQIDLAD